MLTAARMVDRSWKLVVVVAVASVVAVLGPGCAHGGHRIPELAPTAEQLGCFQLRLGPYTPGGSESVYTSPPELFELRTEPEELGRALGLPARVLRPLSKVRAGGYLSGVWWPLSQTEIALDWGNGFCGVTIHLKRTVDGWSGTAKSHWDNGDDSQTATAQMRRISCPPPAPLGNPTRTRDNAPVDK
jgi:hypothetical protein